LSSDNTRRILSAVNEDRALEKLRRAKAALDRARREYLLALETAHSAGIGYRRLAEAVGTDAPSIMRFMKRNAR
jgi:hypothetical protein